MTLYASHNLYRGINAHLHSLLQAEAGAWEEFHTAHIVILAMALDEVMPEGYVVTTERSMQIREYHPTIGEPVAAPRKRRPKLEVTFSSTLTPATPSWSMPLRDTIAEDPEIYLNSIVIREVIDHKIGELVALIELLSPTNKPSGSGYLQYREKRISMLRAGKVLVEVDYLHETYSPVRNIASYPEGDENAFPYTIIVADPRPTLEAGETAVYGFSVDQILPNVLIPLKGTDTVVLDFNATYHRTFNSFGAFGIRVDYSQPPVHFDRYSADDRERILARMQAAANQ